MASGNATNYVYFNATCMHIFIYIYFFFLSWHSWIRRLHLVWQEHWQRASALNSCNKSGFMKLSVTLFTLIILISIAWNFQYIERQGCRVVAWGGGGRGGAVWIEGLNLLICMTWSLWLFYHLFYCLDRTALSHWHWKTLSLQINSMKEFKLISFDVQRY